MNSELPRFVALKPASRRTMLFAAAWCIFAAALGGMSRPVLAGEAAKPYLGGWDLTIPGGGAGWLGVSMKQDGSLQADILWGGGSVLPVTTATIEDGKLVLTRVQRSGGKATNDHHDHRRVKGDDLTLTISVARENGEAVSKMSSPASALRRCRRRPTCRK